MGIDIGRAPFASGTALANEMVSNALAFLIQGRVRDGCVGQNRLIVTKNPGWTIDRYPHHPQLVPQASQILTTLLHGNELRSKT